MKTFIDIFGMAYDRLVETYKKAFETYNKYMRTLNNGSSQKSSKDEIINFMNTQYSDRTSGLKSVQSSFFWLIDGMKSYNSQEIIEKHHYMGRTQIAYIIADIILHNCSKGICSICPPIAFELLQELSVSKYKEIKAYHIWYDAWASNNGEFWSNELDKKTYYNKACSFMKKCKGIVEKKDIGESFHKPLLDAKIILPLENKDYVRFNAEIKDKDDLEKWIKNKTDIDIISNDFKAITDAWLSSLDGSVPKRNAINQENVTINLSNLKEYLGNFDFVEMNKIRSYWRYQSGNQNSSENWMESESYIKSFYNLSDITQNVSPQPKPDRSFTDDKYDIISSMFENTQCCYWQ
jgi:hypothetical protein